MVKQVVVFAHLAPGTEVVEELEALDAPDIELRLRGPCKTPDDLLEAVRDADVATCMKEPYTREVLANASRLKMVMRYGVGVDTGAGPSSQVEAQVSNARARPTVIGRRQGHQENKRFIARGRRTAVPPDKILGGEHHG